MLLYEVILVITLTLTVWFKYTGKEAFPLFLPFMVMVVLVELFLEQWCHSMYGSNFPVMNVYAKLCMYYYLFIFYRHYKEERWSGKLLVLILVYIAVTLIWYFGFHDPFRIDYLSYNAGYLILFPLMFRYLYEVIYIRTYYNIFRETYFYFVFGLLFFYTSSFPILGFINILITDNPRYEAYYDLLNVGNIFLSLAYLGAALCSNNRIQSTTSS